MGVAQKLQMKPGQTIAVLNTPEGYMAQLAPQLEGLAVVDYAPGMERPHAALAFLNNAEQVGEWVPRGIELVGVGGMLWLAYPKGASKVKTDLNRDTLWKAVEPFGWRPVRQIALDDVWSAMRFRPLE